MSGLSEISEYFGKGVSGFVGNKFRVEIAALGFHKLRFYVKKCAMPFENLMFVEDIYVSESTLARPKNVIAVQSWYDLSMTLRMDESNQIIKNLQSLFRSTHNLAKYETSRSPTLFTVSIVVYGANYETVYSKGFSNCSIVEMNAYDVDSSDRKLKDYEIKILTNGNPMYSNTNSMVPLADGAKVKCTDEAAKIQAALKKYRDAYNKYKSPSPEGNYYFNESRIMQALTESSILAVLGAAKKNSNICSRINGFFPFDISPDVNPTAHAKIKEYATQCGLNVSTDIRFQNDKG